MEMDRKLKMELAGIVTVALMLSALAWMMLGGLGSSPAPLVLFSITLSVAIVLFGTWFTDGKHASRASSADEAEEK